MNKEINYIINTGFLPYSDPDNNIIIKYLTAKLSVIKKNIIDKDLEIKFLTNGIQKYKLVLRDIWKKNQSLKEKDLKEITWKSDNCADYVVKKT